MSVTWLHISDFHIRGGDPYDREVVLKALVRAIAEYRSNGWQPDLVFATGDIAFSGTPEQYAIATTFFDEVLAAAKLERRQMYVIPGNHDVDREAGRWLLRTLNEDADAYFEPKVPKPHLLQKLNSFISWHDGYFTGIRAWPKDSTCGPVEAIEVRKSRLAILPINSALFCQDDQDHNKLWVGRRCLSAAIDQMRKLNADVSIALIHHPLEWLHDSERSNIKATLQANVNFVLRGHLHENDVESVVSGAGQSLYCAAGAAYQTRKWPCRALYGRMEAGGLTIFPVRYEDSPEEVWTDDPSLYPHEPGHVKVFAIPREQAAPTKQEAAPIPKGRTNVGRLKWPLVGRDELLKDICARLGDPAKENVLVLQGQAGAGKSELAFEFARRERGRYPGGTFFLDASKDAVAVELARLGKTTLQVDFPADLPLQDQGLRTLQLLGTEPTLLIYDNAFSEAIVEPWIPPAGSACHVLITTTTDHWGPGWACVEVPPLSRDVAVDLIEKLAGPDVARRFGKKLAEISEGLPVQICPAAATLAYEAKRGRLDSAQLTLTAEAAGSFQGVFERQDGSAQLLLQAAAFLNNQRIPKAELFIHMKEGAGWTESQFEAALDACADSHLLEGGAQLRMHQLFAAFVLGARKEGQAAELLKAVRAIQMERLAELARQVGINPANAELIGSLLVFPLNPQPWEKAGTEIVLLDAEKVGRGLYWTGRFDEALPWFRIAIQAMEATAASDKIDHQRLGSNLHDVGYCLSGMGKYEEARTWYDRAAEAKKLGDLQGRVDHASLGLSLHQAGFCLSSLDKFEEAGTWFERAAEEKKQGDIQGRPDHDSLGRSLHQAGFCLWSLGKFEEARARTELAAEEVKLGNTDGRVDHVQLGKSLYQVGSCHSSLGKYAEAQKWYERAVEEHKQGDIHGRVDHENLGQSIHGVGYCLSNLGKHEEAIVLFKRAVEERNQGDIFGRVDFKGVTTSMQWIAYCLRKLGKEDEAAEWDGKVAESQSQAEAK